MPTVPVIDDHVIAMKVGQKVAGEADPTACWNASMPQCGEREQGEVATAAGDPINGRTRITAVISPRSVGSASINGVNFPGSLYRDCRA